MNDVRRALLFWPAFTSALIILISLISPMDGGSWSSVFDDARAEWQKFAYSVEAETKPLAPLEASAAPVSSGPGHQVASEILYSRLPSPLANTAIADRIERGGQAMRLPERVAEVLSRPTKHSPQAALRDAVDLYAATRSDKESLSDKVAASDSEAGSSLLLQPAQNDKSTLSELSGDRLAGDFVGPERPSSEPEAVVQPIGTNLLRQNPFQSEPLVQANSPRSTEPLYKSKTATEPNSIAAAVPKEERVFKSTNDQPNLNVERQPLQSIKPDASVMPQSIANLAKVIPRNTTRSQKPQPEISGRSVDADRALLREPVSNNQFGVSGNPSTWPLTPRLEDQLQRLTKASGDESSEVSEATNLWAARVQSTMSDLRRLPRLGEPEAGRLIEELKSLALQGFHQAERLNNREMQIDWLQASHAIYRRTSVWEPIWAVVSNKQPLTTTPTEADNGAAVESLVQELKSEMTETGDAAGWSSYLLLDEIVDSATGQKVNQRQLTAQRVLSRTRWHGLGTQQSQWLQRDSVQYLVSALQPWTRTPVDYAALLNQIERQESDAVDLAAIDIAGTAQSLRSSNHEGTLRVAKSIDACYRNANIRTAVSQEMLTRLIPDVAPTTVPVRTNIMGSRVKGISHVNSELDLELRPSRDSWAFTLQAIGNVRTHSVGQRGQAAIRTRGDSSFIGSTPIEITPEGAQLGQSQIDVSGRTRLRDVNSQYDNWPLLGDLARSIIAAKYKQRSGLTSGIANRRMTKQIGDGIDERLEAKVAKASARLNDVVMGPLNSLKLQPQVMDMQTTDQRLIARYRLAGDWQIGASTPRPRAPNDSLISVQINQSAMNNTLEQVVPLGEPITIQAAFDNTMKVLGREQFALPEDIPNDVMIQFAKTRPITVELEDGLLWITMRVVELSRQKGASLRRFIVRAGYRAQIDGLRVSLVRDGHLSISGPGMAMRQRLPIRAVFNKVFSPNHSIPLTSEAFARSESLADAEISQLELRDGWFAMALSRKRAGRIAVGTSGESSKR
ncbi:hypothetical protein [Planctomycetes bacterium K23_9]|uniref:Uncharacterized protein n=1 Tax=Stieleria marina TaxID=1930275 RepID=A0A517NYC6_9BACT|nr:hypothetical protein K239x_41360 [Planctomycetes bacterium K23_9]